MAPGLPANRRAGRRCPAPPVLRVAEQQDFVRRNGFARREIREPPRRSDLVALKNPGIALDRLHERAGFALLGGAALAEAAAAQSCPELIDRLGGRRKIVRGIVVGVHRQIGFDPFEPRDHAGEGAHVLAETCNRGRRRNGPVSAARHDQLAAGAKLDRHRRTARVAQLLAAAGRTLRAGRHVMLHDGRAQQVEADDVIAQVRAKVGGDRFRDLDGRKLDGALSDRVPGERRNRDAARLSAVEQRLDLSVPFHPIGKTGPTGALAWAEHRPHQGKNAGGLGEQPGRMVRQMLPVQFGQSSFEIIAHQRDRQVGGALDDANAQPTQGGAEFRCTLHVDRLNAHTAFLEIFLRGLRRQAEARPIGGRGASRRARCRDNIAAVDQPLQGFLDFVGRKILLQLASELPKALSTLSYRGRERTIELAVKKELPVLGIEAHDIGWQHIDGEIRRELRNVFAVVLRKLFPRSPVMRSVRAPSPHSGPPVQGVLSGCQSSVF